jgi:serine/threonine protein kinase/nicotinamidase-related amidase
MRRLASAGDAEYQPLKALDAPNEIQQNLLGQHKSTHERCWMIIISLRECHQHLSDQIIEQEVQNLKQISHQSIVSLSEAYFMHHECHLIFPFVRGLSLTELIWQIPSPTIADQIKWMKQTLSGLNYLHTVTGRPHGNLTPENILITSSKARQVKIVGLEVSCLHQPPNPSYISYERTKGLEYDGRDDIWAFGLIFSELLLGMKPNLSSDCCHLNDINSEESEKRRHLLLSNCLEVSPEIGAILQLALQVRQTDRGTADALVQFINQQAATSTVTGPSPGAQPLSPLPSIGAGDVVYIENFLDADSLTHLMANIHRDINWSQLTHVVHCNCFPRLTSFQALIEEDGTLPIYRCADPQPWDNQYTTCTFTPSIRRLKEKIEQFTGENYNWCRMLQYRQDNDDMGYHSDKYLDIAKGSYIVSFSIGQTRDYLLKLKKGSQRIKEDGRHQKISLTHNSLLLLGPMTNMHYLHSIAKRSNHDKKGFDWRISITFRNIATYYSPLYYGLDRCCFYGQGVPNIATKAQMIQSYRHQIIRRHLQIAFSAVVGYFTSSALMNLVTMVPTHKSFWIGLTTALSGLTARFYLISSIKAMSRKKKWRHMAVYRLLNLLPLDPPAALRLLEKASLIELESMLQTGKKNAKEAKDEPSIAYQLEQTTAVDAPRLTSHSLESSVQQHRTSSDSPTLPSSSIVSSYESNRTVIKQVVVPLHTNPMYISVCIFIDVLNDFMLPSGVFCQTYGLEDTHRIRNIHPNLIDLYQYCHKRSIQVILVTSHYHPKQFKRVNELCSTEDGQGISLPLQQTGSKPDILHIKTANSIMNCSQTAKEILLQTIQNQNVLICGVTTLCCVCHAVDNLMAFASKIILTKDTVASRDTCHQQELSLFEKWNKEQICSDMSRRRGDLRIFETWKELLT